MLIYYNKYDFHLIDFIVQRSLKFKNGELIEIDIEYAKHIYNLIRIFEVSQKLVSICIALLNQALVSDTFNVFEIISALVW